MKNIIDIILIAFEDLNIPLIEVIRELNNNPNNIIYKIIINGINTIILNTVLILFGVFITL